RAGGKIRKSRGPGIGQAASIYYGQAAEIPAGVVGDVSRCGGKKAGSRFALRVGLSHARPEGYSGETVLVHLRQHQPHASATKSGTPSKRSRRNARTAFGPIPMRLFSLPIHTGLLVRRSGFSDYAAAEAKRAADAAGNARRPDM